MNERLSRIRDSVGTDSQDGATKAIKTQDPQNRLVVLFVGFVLVSAALIAVLVDIQTVRNDDLRNYGENQRSRTRQLDGYRGQVLDRNGSVLANSTPSSNVIADPTRVQDVAKTAKLLAPLLELDEAALIEKLSPDDERVRYISLARNVGDEVADTIEDMDSDEAAILGIYIESEELRVYPVGNVARQIVGRVDPEENGVTGIEQQYDRILDGEPGTERFESGRFGRISVGESVLDPATQGYDVTLTLDHRLQFMAEQTLIEHCEATGARSATAVVSDPATGDILVMASVDRDEDDRCEVAGYNTALVDSFEPGSVLKPITIAGAAEEFGLTSESQIEVPPSIKIANKSFVDRPAHPAAMFPLSQVLADSMNVGTIRVAQELGIEGVHSYLQQFGVGQSTGLGFQGESIGTLREPADWQGSDAGSIPIGQGVTVNATQLVAAYNVFANGGVYQEPLLISSLRNSNGEYFSPDPRPTRTVLSPEAASEVLTMLEQVVTDGTGKRAAIPGYTVAGKTGTAWKVFEDSTGKRSYGVPGDRRYVVTFAGLVPASNPRLSMVVVVNEPRDIVEASAGVVAAPIFAEIAEDSLRVLDIAPDNLDLNAPGLVRGSPTHLPVPVVKRAPKVRPATTSTLPQAVDVDTAAVSDSVPVESPVSDASNTEEQTQGLPEQDGADEQGATP